MQEITFLSQSLSLLTLLVISSLTYILSKKLNFIYTVMLVFVGILLVPLSNIEIFSFINDFKLTPNILFFIFLPVLLFEWAYNINYRKLLKNWKTISSLAIVGLFISSIFIGVSLHLIFSLTWFIIPLFVCLLFWALISATDPTAVLSIFNKLWTPKKLNILFEWESLFNDGTSVALFMVILWIILEWWVISNTTYLYWIWRFVSMILWWIIFWIFTWILFSNIIWYIKNNEKVEIVLIIVLAHFTFIMAEVITGYFSFLPISWVISTVTASIIIWNYWKYKITPKAEIHMQKFWQFFVFISNSLVFILLWSILSSVNIIFLPILYFIIVSIIVIVVARAISVYLSVWLANIFSLKDKIPPSRQHLLAWWSLRWVLAIMMVLMIPWVWDKNYDKILIFQETVWWNYPFDIKELLILLTASVILFTFFIKAPTISSLMKRVWISKLDLFEKFENEEGKIFANLKILKKLDISHKKVYITEKEYKKLKQRYSDKLKESIKKMKIIIGRDQKKSKKIIKRIISLHALWIEKQYLYNLFLWNEIDENNFKYIFRKIEKQIEMIKEDSCEFEKIRDSQYNYNIFSRLSIWLYKDFDSVVNVYIRNRAKLIITRKVIKELRELEKIDFWFEKKQEESSVFWELIDVFANFNKVADEKRIKVFIKNKDLITDLESKLINKSLLMLEERVFKDLYKKEMINYKLYSKFKEEVENELFSDVKGV